MQFKDVFSWTTDLITFINSSFFSSNSANVGLLLTFEKDKVAQ
jgi:hypothetical protein